MALDNKPWEAVGFYSVIGAATILGLVINYVGLDPIKALFWSAVVNGVIAPPIMASMMYVIVQQKRMGKFKARAFLTFLGWLSTAIMTVAAIAMFVTM